MNQAEEIRQVINDPASFDKLLDQAFVQTDFEHNGFIDKLELGKVMNDIASTGIIPIPTEAEIEKQFNELDKLHDGHLTKEEFAVFLRKIMLTAADVIEKEGKEILLV